jgi:16S rRNA (cytidine1402-2'-O)-methyltransferase
MTFRAVDVLKNCDLILAEDTRHSIYLLQHFAISKPLKSYHQHNEQERAAEIINVLKQENKQVALITDAGMPMISDPGYLLVKAALENNIAVTVVPGPTAFASAISLSGIDCSEFVFIGFLSSKQSERLKVLAELNKQQKALVLYESPHRLLSCLKDVLTVCGSDRIISVVKEITKAYENIYHGRAVDILAQLSTLESIKGEYVVIISGNNLNINLAEQEIITALKLFKSEDVSTKIAVKIIAGLFNLKKNHVYDLALKLDNEL